jgi:hypothetical protein
MGDPRSGRGPPVTLSGGLSGQNVYDAILFCRIREFRSAARRKLQANVTGKMPPNLDFLSFPAGPRRRITGLCGIVASSQPPGDICAPLVGSGIPMTPA